MFHIGSRSIWFDEGFSAVLSGSRWSEITRVARSHDPNMTGYHAALHLWRDVFGSGEIALRSLSAVAVAASVLAIVALTRRLRDARTALVAGLILAVAPLVVRYGQEARSYALEVLAVTAATYCFVRLVDPDDAAADHAWPVVAYAALAAYSCYLHLFGALVIAAHVVSLTLVPPAWLRWRRLGATAGLLAVLLLPLLTWLAGSTADQISWIQRPGPDDLFHVSSEIAGGDVITAVLGLLVIVAAVHWLGVVRRGRSRELWSEGVGLLWLVLPFVVAFAISITVQPIFLGRYLIVCVPALALVAATAVMQIEIRSRALAVGAVVIVAVASVVGVARDYGGSIQNWRDATAIVAARATADDGVILCPGGRRPPFDYYLTRMMPPDRRPVALSPPGDWGSGLHFSNARPEDVDGPDRIWVIGDAARCGFDLGDRTLAFERTVDEYHIQRLDRA